MSDRLSLVFRRNVVMQHGRIVYCQICAREGGMDKAKCRIAKYTRWRLEVEGRQIIIRYRGKWSVR